MYYSCEIVEPFKIKLFIIIFLLFYLFYFFRSFRLYVLYSVKKNFSRKLIQLQRSQNTRHLEIKFFLYINAGNILGIGFNES